VGYTQWDLIVGTNMKFNPAQHSIMKIIKRCKPHRITCPDCKSILEYVEKDLVLYHYRTNLGSKLCPVAICPVCFYPIKIEVIE
jgi:hypothetical protein